MLKEPADTRASVKLGGALSSAAGLTLRQGDGAVRERADTAVGDGDSQDLRGKVGEGGGPIWSGLAVDIPGDIPDLWIDAVEEAGALPLLFEDRAVDR